ncbi:MAG: OB-fold nucleic acid binding domain-containing protein [Actinomycetota bacterium]|nr:OB-fold nucleic acid binding domain-containing protein [Actinomycetota bacterium]
MPDELSSASPQSAADVLAPTGRLRRALRRLSSQPEALDAEVLQEQLADAGATPVAACGDRKRVCLAGTLRTVTLRPRGGAPALDAELWDGSGTVTLVWLGRRRIKGIDPGRSIVVRGRVSVIDGQRTIFNPTYELRPTG